jgi:hypothetical protein
MVVSWIAAGHFDSQVMLFGIDTNLGSSILGIVILALFQLADFAIGQDGPIPFGPIASGDELELG